MGGLRRVRASTSFTEQSPSPHPLCQCACTTILYLQAVKIWGEYVFPFSDAAYRETFAQRLFKVTSFTFYPLIIFLTRPGWQTSSSGTVFALPLPKSLKPADLRAIFERIAERKRTKRSVALTKSQLTNNTGLQRSAREANRVAFSV